MQGGGMVYHFSQGSADMKNLLGGKGANLAEMSRIGLPVPPGFIITTEACSTYFKSNNRIWPELEQEIIEKLSMLEQDTGRTFGGDKPLLISVRSGAVVSMPGMMDTILNLGLNERTVEGLAAETSNRRFALDCYRRFIQMFGEVVLKIEHINFENILEKAREERQVINDAGLEPGDLESVIRAYLELVRRETGADFPSQPREQLLMAVRAVFESWNTPRASVYRQINKIPGDLCTAVNVQVMVFGNLGDDSGTGVAFTRNPSTGEAVIYGEYLLNAQGEDVVAGIRTPRPLSDLRHQLPEVYEEFIQASRKLEAHYKDMQDIEFTVEKGRLYILQTRSGKRTAAAAVQIAVDLAGEGVITKNEALKRVEPDQLEQLMHRRIDPDSKLDVVAAGLPASPGAASGKVIFNADRVEEISKQGEKVLLVRPETTPDDIHGINAAAGILTSRGGMTSHAAVVARQMNKPCVCGCEALKIDAANGKFYLDGREYPEGELLSIDGSTGKVILGQVPMIEPELSPKFKKLLNWADQACSLKVRANADTPRDAAKALELGARGIGLCRTEHMFMHKERIPVVQKMILADTLEERKTALADLLPMQQQDFKGILKVMAGYPVTIRLLDPPLHEFLPDREAVLLEVERLRREKRDSKLLLEKEALLQKIRALSEQNPMLGHRGCRMGLSFPEIYRMQVQAIFKAVAELLQEGLPPGDIKLEIMIPLVAYREELACLKQLVREVASKVLGALAVDLPYMVGTMIELPRACIVAHELAGEAEFFSFGTNDLTQTTLGCSRDDAEGKFLTAYIQEKIISGNPFMEIDREGVGRLLSLAADKGRSTRPGIKMGVCGEHGGDPSSIEFFHQLNLDYISCSPYRVPIARLAAARVSIQDGLKKCRDIN